jgi:hypothetical protein
MAARALSGGESWGSVPSCGPRQVRRLGRRDLEALIRLESPGLAVAKCRQRYISVCFETDPLSYPNDFGSVLLFEDPGGRVVFAI